MSYSGGEGKGDDSYSDSVSDSQSRALTTALIKLYMIVPKEGTPKLSGLLRSNHRSPVCTHHNG